VERESEKRGQQIVTKKEKESRFVKAKQRTEAAEASFLYSVCGQSVSHEKTIAFCKDVYMIC
jgi:hypothetical protein